MSLSKQSIRIKNVGDWNYEERNAAESGIYPGMLLLVNSSGLFIKNNVAEKKAQCQVAIEDALQGKIVTDVYVDTYPVRSHIFRPGEEFHGYLAAYQTISIGEILVPDGSGGFKSGGDSAVDASEGMAVALEAATYGASAQLIHMRAL